MIREELMVNAKTENKTNKTRKRMYIFIGIMLALFFARNCLGVAVPTFVFLIVSLIPATSKSESDIVALGACCIPMAMGFQHKYALMMGIIALLLRGKINFKKPHIVISVLFLMFWELIHGLNAAFSLGKYMRDFAELIFLATISCTNLEDIDYKLVFRSLAISTVGVCIIILYIRLKQTGFNIIEIFSQDEDSFRFGEGNIIMDSFRLTFNPNALGFICNLSTTCLLILYGRQEHSHMDLVLLAFCVLFGMTTLSRAYIICLAFIVLYFIISLPGNVGQKVSRIIGIIFLGSLLAFIIYIFFPTIIENFIARFNVSDITNGRSSLFAFYNEHIVSSFKHFVYGVGLQDFEGKIRSIYKFWIGVGHNGLQQIWVVWGIVGMFAFFTLLWGMITIPKKPGKKHKPYQYMPLLLILLYTMAGQFITSYVQMIALSIAYVCFFVGSKEELPISDEKSINEALIEKANKNKLL